MRMFNLAGIEPWLTRPVLTVLRPHGVAYLPIRTAFWIPAKVILSLLGLFAPAPFDFV